MTNKFFYVILATLFTSITWSQAPEQFKYQAVVRNDVGALLEDQTVGIRINLHLESEDGAIVYQEHFTENTNNYGLVYLDLGTGTVTIGEFNTIDWGNGPFFIETLIDVEGGVDFSTLGTTELVSVPYALYANNSANAAVADHAETANHAEEATHAAHSDTAEYANNVVSDDYYFQATSGWVEQTITGTNYTEFAEFGTEVLDPSNSYNPATSTFTAPAEGVYAFSSFLTVAGNEGSSAGGVFFGYILNDADFPDPGTVPTSVLSPGEYTTGTVVSVSGLIHLEEGDQVRFGIIGASDGEMFNLSYSGFSGYKIR